MFFCQFRRHLLFGSGARLIALKKPEGGVRPIAIGEILRRICSKIVNTHLVPKCRPDLLPEQVGVGVKSACEIAIHATRDVLEKHKDDNSMVLVKVDLTNAFNLVERKVFLDYIRENHPKAFN